MRSLLRIFIPTKVSLAIFVAMVMICVGGVIETYAFIDDVPGVQKPPMYNYISVIEFWIPWVYLTLPLHLVGAALNLGWIVKFFPELSPGFTFPLASVFYAYILSCWAVYSWRRWVIGGRRKVLLVFIVSIVIAAVIYPVYAIFVIPELILADIIRYTSGYSLVLLVVVVYVVALLGIVNTLRELAAKQHSST